MKSKCLDNNAGVALPSVVAFFLIFTILGFSLLGLARAEIQLTRKECYQKKAFYAAEAGLEYGIAKLKQLLSEQGQFVDLDDGEDIAVVYNIVSPALEGFTYDEFSIVKVGGVELEVISSGPYNGMNSLTQRFKITSHATSDTMESAEVSLVQWVEDQNIPLFQFAVIYDQDLEMEPGPPMTINGRIHSNGYVYLESGSTMSIDSYLTTSRNIYRSGKPGDPSGAGGDVRIKDEFGVYQYMDFDSTDPDWSNKALARWGGKVQSQTHQIPTFQLPLPEGIAPIEIIRRSQIDDSEALQEARLYYQADLRIIDGIAYDKSGNVVDLTYVQDANTIEPIDTSKSFFNHREEKDIEVTEIDIAKLIEGGKLPANGILYMSSHTAAAGNQDSIRLVNGSALPASGLTICTDNPLYIYGDYNLNKAPASILSDAINILSNSWQDGGGWQIATNTEINVSILAGHSPTTRDGYGGGLENFPRFSEDWTSRTLTWNGSMSSFWASAIATGEWKSGQPYYSAPNRNWGFTGTINLSDLPPGTPTIRRLHRFNWSEESL